MKNLFSVDLEEWYHYEYLLKSASKDTKLLPKCIPPLLDLLRKRDTTITFFALAKEAQAQPEIIDQIKAAGHEIASHGYDHTQLGKMTKEQFAQDLVKSKEILKKVAHVTPLGYRAPYFSMTKNQPWAFDVLREQGFKYDSSLFPTKTPLYGAPESPLSPYRPSKYNMFVHDQQGDLVEFPASISTRLVVKRIPFLGGFYMRSLPYFVIKRMLKDINEKLRPGVMYFHPWEPFADVPRLKKLSFFHKFVSYHGNKGFMNKLDRLLKDFEWGPYKDAYEKV